MNGKLNLSRKVCLCSLCNREIETWWEDGKRIGPPPARFKGRPVCARCVKMREAAEDDE